MNTPTLPYDFGDRRYKCRDAKHEVYFKDFLDALEYFERFDGGIVLSVATYSLFSQNVMYVWLRMKSYDRYTRSLRVEKNPDYYSPKDL